MSEENLSPELREDAKDAVATEEPITDSKSETAETASEPSENAPEILPEHPVLISVIMPIFNASSYLRPAMDSALAQSFTDFELICVDDGSTDRSLEILREYQSGDPRVRILTETNAGPARARNRGFSRARGKYVFFLDADDFGELSMFSTLFEMAEKDNLDIAISNYDLYVTRTSKFVPKVASERENLLIPGKVTSRSEHPDDLFQLTAAHIWNKLFRTGFLREKNLLFDDGVRCMEDEHFSFLALAMAERIACTDEVLVHHRVYTEQFRNRWLRRYGSEVPGMFLRLKQQLVQNGLYLPVRTSLVNLSADRCYKVFTLLHSKQKKAFFDTLHSEMAEKLGWNQIPAGEYGNAEVCEFVATVQFCTYEMYLERMSHGTHLRIPFITRFLDRRLKNERRKNAKDKNMPGFFARLAALFRKDGEI